MEPKHIQEITFQCLETERIQNESFIPKTQEQLLAMPKDKIKRYEKLLFEEFKKVSSLIKFRGYDK